MSWNLQSQHTNSAVYPFGNSTFPISSSYSSNTNLSQYQSAATNTTHIHPINDYNTNRNAFTPNHIFHTNHNQNNAAIPQFTKNQLQNINLPPLPKELQLNTPIHRHSKIHPIALNTNNTNNTHYNGTILNTAPFSNLYRSNSLNSIHPMKSHSNMNQLMSNAATININHVNHINNIKNVNINQNGTIHNTITPNYIMNNARQQQSNANQFIRQFMMQQRQHQHQHQHQHQQQHNVHKPPLRHSQTVEAIPKSFSSQNGTNNRCFTQQIALQQMQNTLNHGNIIENKVKKSTQNRIKLKLKRPRFHVHKEHNVNNNDNTVLKRINTIDIPPPRTVTIAPKTPENVAMNANNTDIETMELNTSTVLATIGNDTAPSITMNTDKEEIMEECESKETKDTVTEEETTQRICTTLDDELFVDVNGVTWDNTVNWVCGVCDGADAQKENALVVCEGCSRAVHEHCYGITQKQLSSDNDWYCECCRYKQYILQNIYELRDMYASIKDKHNDQWSVSALLKYNKKERSKINRFDDIIMPNNVLIDDNATFSTFFSGSSLPSCALCSSVGGSYKVSCEGKWVHMSCSMYHPEIYFNDAQHSSDAVLSEISMESAAAMCNVCGSSVGACVECTHKCGSWFHITCMQKQNLYLFYSKEEPLRAYCAEHTQIFKINRYRNKKKNKRQRISGRKRTRQQMETEDGNQEYVPKTRNNKRKPRSKRSRKPKLDVNTRIMREFSPEPSDAELEYIGNRLRAYIDNLLCDSTDDISSISSQETKIEIAHTHVHVQTPRKKRRKSAVDLLSHSSFSLKRNKWIMNQTFHLYPNHGEFYESKDFEMDCNTNNGNHWTVETTTDPTQLVAEQCMRSVETLWTHRQTNLLAKSQNSRDYRKAIGFSILRNPSRDVITSCAWSFWEVSATKKAVLIKLFITEPYSKSHIPQRRKKNGTLLAAHVMDISFRLRDDVDWIVICSERGIAEIFWRALGFTDFSAQEKRSFCRGTEKDLNQFRDTILLRMHHDEYVNKYCDNTKEWEDDNCAVQKVFRKWRKKHLFMKRRLVFKHKGNTVNTHEISSY